MKCEMGWGSKRIPLTKETPTTRTDQHGECMKLTGGYMTYRRPLVRVAHNKHTADLAAPISQLDLDAINAVQATPWRINTLILDTMMDAWTSGKRIAGLEVGEPLALPDRVADEVWASTPPSERHEAVQKRVAIHATNATIMGRSNAIWDALSIAEELREKPAIYYPHAKDFRGRIYPEASIGPQPQGSDIQRALLHFADGVPLGDAGEFWLYIRAANTFGQDKLTLEDRVRWARSHLDDIQHAAQAPLEYKWWTEADEPWSFLATCFEIAMVLDMSPASHREFVSHLPCPMDGTCNGLQHLAAMGLDPIGARATNLTPDNHRQDIYEEVAKLVRQMVVDDIIAGVPEALAWDGKITRKVVKRSVMTTPYGVTDRGIRDQLIKDGLVPDEADAKGAAADYLKDKLVAALGGTVQSARAIMGWLQDTADRLAKAELPFDWTTPSGSQVRQGYQTTSRLQLRTLVGSVILFTENKDLGLNTRKQSLGAAPNFIHSFDAAHLSLTVDAAARRGITSFAMIHDSYGTHAGHTTELATILRQTFVDIYRTDHLQRLYEAIMTAAPWVKLNKPPQRGEFDIEQVLDAPYFFS